jgi:hypothetical protein
VQQRPQAKPAVGVVFDSDMSGIGDVLALALLYALDGKSEMRVVSLSVTNADLQAAAFCDAVRRFYAAGGFFRGLPIGLAGNSRMPGRSNPALAGPLARRNAQGQPVYPHEIEKLTDTAEPHPLIRNALTAQHDGNAVVVLAGPATNLVKTLELPGVKELVQNKVRFLAMTGGAGLDADPAAAKQLLASWPTSIVIAGQDVGEALPFPGECVETDFSWAASHPLVDAYRAHKPMPYDTPSPEMAAALHALRPDAGYFKLSEPSADGKVRRLIADPTQKDRVIKTYRELVSAKPVPRRPRFAPQQQQQAPRPKPKPDAK